MGVTKKTLAVLGGAAALAVAVGFGGVTVNSPSNTTTRTPPSGVSGVPAPNIATHGVHRATLTGCISHLDC